MAQRKRSLSFTEVSDRVLVAMSKMDQMQRLPAIAKAADVKVKDAQEALKQLVKDRKVDQWPAIKAYKITVAGLEAAAILATRTDTRFQWTWNKRGEYVG